MNAIKLMFDKLYIKSFWDLLTWLVIASLFLWGIAKAFGWINTPALVELYPLFGVVFLAGKFYQDVMRLKSDVKTHDSRLTKIEKDHGSRLITIEKDVKRIESAHGSRLMRIERNHGLSLARIEQKLGI